MLLVAIALIGAVICGVLKNNGLHEKYFQTLDIQAEITNVMVMNKTPDSTGRKKFLYAELNITNNSSTTIGLDPNICDYETFVNDVELDHTKICTLMAGIIPIQRDQTYHRVIFAYAPDAKSGDSVYIRYGYNLIEGVKYPIYGRDYSSFVTSNTVIIK